MKYNFKNLVLEGGGVKGLAYIGSLNVLDKKGILKNIDRVAGSSAGAIVALLIGLDYSMKEIEEILKTTNIMDFLDDDWGVIRDTIRFFREYGIYPGDSFRVWIGKLIEEKTGNSECTFKDFHDKGIGPDMYFLGTNLSTGFSDVFSFEHTPSTCIADAVRMSMSIPLFFKAVEVGNGDIYVDGGLINNYPIRLFDHEIYTKGNYSIPEFYEKQNKRLPESKNPFVYNKETIGFRLDSKEEIDVFNGIGKPARRKINNFFDYSSAIVETILESQSNIHLNSHDWHRTIYIDTLGVTTIEFDISEEKKLDLIESGRKNTEKYFEWYDNSEALNK
ncbi:patatin-like phospholipase family protein [Oceanirhabdus sp. W0125-5]|uniref:patatin-like phospholipase family protein n=1 Tax=Oceanirhabdus sp. W0125-5 TaxID=2999116 RepID=UPI0022F2AE26|nr:patatin-like phospholipase family protein [Oceanirhabdus sp. W0125-5]WBW98983.1 patatin-like phospholipase family protein [Oceanirhabdus sp. W0125-5]